MLAAIAGGLAMQGWLNGGHSVSELQNLVPTSVTAVASSIGKPFGLCSAGYQSNCVVDGDTIHYQGQKIRMLDYDTPEISEPKCASEYALGQRAKLRLLELLNSGTVSISAPSSRDEDKYGRKLRIVSVNGRSVGDILISEGLAWKWEGHKHRWC